MLDLNQANDLGVTPFPDRRFAVLAEISVSGIQSAVLASSTLNTF